jgi:uncharacterized protein YbjT (DUF2867 family)
MKSPILVTGGTGRLGGRVVARLVDAGRDVRVLTRHERDAAPLVHFFVGDLRRDEGIDPAVSGVETIIHCATATKGDGEATRNLVKAAASQSSSPHFVCPSIVGIDRVSWGYTKAKVEVERIVEDSRLPWTILRVTQFYDYCLENSQKIAKIPLVAPVPNGFLVRPVDPDDVADRLVELAVGKPVGRAPEMAGPQVSSWVDLFRSYLTATHRHRLVLPVWMPGSKPVRNGALLPSAGYTEGTKTWDQFLAARLPDTSPATT